jgi:hypothetical protein
MTASVQVVTRDELLALVDQRRAEVQEFVNWAEGRETGCRSMYLANRRDITEAGNAGSLYPEAWWGVVVFTCFGSLNSTRTLRDVLPQPFDAQAAEDLLAAVRFSRPTVGHHRIRQGLLGAKKALVAACRDSEVLHEVLHTRRRNFDERYQVLLSAHLDRWGRTTCFDLLLRTGALGVGGPRYEPEIAYLAGSTGPKAGFRVVWGRTVTAGTGPWCEGILQAWHRHWPEVVDRVGAHWSGRPYAPGDLENALCIYQEPR